MSRMTNDLVLAAGPELTEGYAVLDRAARHRGWPDTVEFVAQLLPAFPGQELVQRYRPAKDDIYGGQRSTATAGQPSMNGSIRKSGVLAMAGRDRAE